MLGLYILLFLLLFIVLYLIRNEQVFIVRLHFLRNRQRKDYENLPSYDEMHLNPKYFGLWSVGQWIDWVEKHQ